jgi:hypothetical protein
LNSTIFVHWQTGDKTRTYADSSDETTFTSIDVELYVMSQYENGRDKIQNNKNKKAKYKPHTFRFGGNWIT